MLILKNQKENKKRDKGQTAHAQGYRTFSVRVTCAGNNDKFIVIGRSMDTRVHPIVEELRAAGAQAESWQGFDPALSTETNLQNNREWITGKVNDGYSVIDIGLDPAFKNTPTSTEKGPFYEMETETAKEMKSNGKVTLSKNEPATAE